VFAVLELHLQITFPLLQLGYQITVALLEACVQIMLACRATLEALQFALELEDKLLEFLYLEAALLDLDLEVDVLFEGSIDLVWSELCKTFFEKVYAEFDIEVFFLEGVDVLL
jgi:hypothetical protein